MSIEGQTNVELFQISANNYASIILQTKLRLKFYKNTCFNWYKLLTNDIKLFKSSLVPNAKIHFKVSGSPYLVRGFA